MTPRRPIDWRALMAEVRAQRDARAVDDFEWIAADGDLLAREVYNRRALLWTAPIVWGDPILASNRLLQAHETQADGGSANLVLSFDARVESAPEILDFVARQIVAVWETPISAGSPLGRWCERLRTGELGSKRSLQRLPDALANGYAVFAASTTFAAAHLPGGRMQFNRLPVFAERDPDGWVMPVPVALWPDALRDQWTQSAAQ